MVMNSGVAAQLSSAAFILDGAQNLAVTGLPHQTK